MIRALLGGDFVWIREDHLPDGVLRTGVLPYSRFVPYEWEFGEECFFLGLLKLGIRHNTPTCPLLVVIEGSQGRIREGEQSLFLLL